MYKKIVNPLTGRKVKISSSLGQQIIKKYIKKYTEQMGGDLVQHKVLGSINYLNELKKKAFSIFNNLSIINYNNDKSKLVIKGATVPHAGFIYSGLVGLLTILETLQNSSVVSILWFRHNENSNTEHSLQNVIELVNLMDKKIKINPILVNSNTLLKNIKIEGSVLVSTDFSHYNDGSQGANNLTEVWNNDRKLFDNTMKKSVKNPCGSEPLRIFKEWSNKNDFKLCLQAYSNSEGKDNWWYDWENNRFKGVTYASLLAIKKPITWFTELKSKLLAYSHLMWVNDYLKENKLGGLQWSPLNNKLGSSFVTIIDNLDKTYSCIGSWEPENSNILECIKQASNSVKTSSWNNNTPVSNDILRKFKNYTISITLIEPIKQWKRVNIRNIYSSEENRGYVYYNKKINKVGMTYLPSVWEMYSNKNDFFDGLLNKHQGIYSQNNSEQWELYMYESISWKFHF